MYNTIKYEVKERIAYFTINRPQAMNALNTEVLTELYNAFSAFRDDKGADVAILTGEGKAFVAGADIAEMNSVTSVEVRDMMIQGHRLMNLMENIEKPIIGAINGFALGGGCELACACDIRLASEKAKFGQPEVNLGITPGFGGTQRLPRLVGRGMGKYLIYTAEIIGADEAHRIGLVEKVYAPDELMDEAVKLAQLLQSKSLIAVGMAKTAINAGFDMGIEAASKIEVSAFASAHSSDERVEGMAAFLEKRPANFKR